MILVPLLIGFLITPTQNGAYRKFQERLAAGADCPELFQLRNEARRAVPSEHAAEMNEQLRKVSCFNSTSKRRDPAPAPPGVETYTLRDYRIYRKVIDTPMSVSQAEAFKRVAKESGITPAEVEKITKKVQGILAKNGWFGSREAEERRASDWKPK